MRSTGPLAPVRDPSSGERLKSKMEEGGHTVASLSRATGLSERTITNLRSGKSGNLATWRAIARALQCTIDEIAG